MVILCPVYTDASPAEVFTPVVSLRASLLSWEGCRPRCLPLFQMGKLSLSSLMRPLGLQDRILCPLHTLSLPAPLLRRGLCPGCLACAPASEEPSPSCWTFACGTPEVKLSDSLGPPRAVER